MAKDIIQVDIPRVKELMIKVLNTDEYKDISRMGGLTNHTYKIESGVLILHNQKIRLNNL